MVDQNKTEVSVNLANRATVKPQPAAVASTPQTIPTAQPPQSISTVSANSTDPQSAAPFAASEGLSAPTNDSVVTWTASEFIAHEKSAVWYFQLGLGAIVLAVIVYMLTKDVVSVVVIIVGVLALAIYGSRQPRQLQYQLDNRGMTVGTRQYDYGNFRSFAVVTEGAFSSIVFMPLKRLEPSVTLYFPPADQEKIVNLLAPKLPEVDYKHDAIDRFLRYIRF